MNHLIIAALIFLFSLSAVHLSFGDTPPGENIVVDSNELIDYLKTYEGPTQKKRKRLLANKEERQKYFDQYNKDKNALEEEYLKSVDLISNNFDGQNKIHHRKIVDDYELKKKKLFEDYRKNSNRLSVEKESLMGRDAQPSSDQTIKRQLPPSFDYKKNFKNTKPKAQNKKTMTGFERRKSQKKKSLRKKTKRKEHGGSSYKRSRYKGSRYKGSGY